MFVTFVSLIGVLNVHNENDTYQTTVGNYLNVISENMKQ
jgi:hypothetical protein